MYRWADHICFVPTAERSDEIYEDVFAGVFNRENKRLVLSAPGDAAREGQRLRHGGWDGEGNARLPVGKGGPCWDRSYRAS